MRKESSFILPLLLLLGIITCTKPKHLSSLSEEDVPVVLSVSLEDTLTPKVTNALKLDNVTGIKIDYLTGREVRYFEYDSEKEALLQAMSNLPFSKYEVLADTTVATFSTAWKMWVNGSIAATSWVGNVEDIVFNC